MKLILVGDDGTVVDSVDVDLADLADAQARPVAAFTILAELNLGAVPS